MKKILKRLNQWKYEKTKKEEKISANKNAIYYLFSAVKFVL